MNVKIISLVPSPYQRDLFRALEQRGEVRLTVHYLEEAAPDSPWPERPLANYERILPGWTAGRGRVRCHANWNLPDFADTDIAIVNTVLTGVTTQQIMMRLRNRRIPWIFWGEALRNRSGLTGVMQQALASQLQKASAIVAIGSVAKSDYQRRFPRTPLYDLPYHCDLSAFVEAAEADRQSRPEPVFLFCGQMIQRKGIDILLDSYRSAWEHGLRARLMLVGRDAELPPLLAALPADARNSIEFLGFQAPESLPEIFAKADVFVLPSRHDGWGVVINQALGAGLPIITTNAVGAAQDFVRHESNGLIVPAGESNPLTEALLQLGQNSELREAMARESSARATSLSPEVGAESLIRILDDVLDTELQLTS